MKVFSYFAAILVTVAGLQAPAHAQRIDPLNVEPDANGVDMLTARVSRPVPVLQIPAAPNLRLERLQLLLPVLTGSESWSGEFWGGSVQLNPGGGTSESFSCIDLGLNGGCSPPARNGSTLTHNGAAPPSRIYYYMQGGNGVRITFNSTGNYSSTGGTRAFSMYPSGVRYPNGESLTFVYDKVSVPGGTRHRPTTVISNLGYRMQLSYRSNDVNVADWRRLSEATIYRTADLSTPLARHTYNANGSITDLAGRTWSCCSDGIDEQVQVNAVTQRLPGETVNSFVATSAANSRYITQIEADGVDWNYNVVETTQPGRCQVLSCDLERITITGPLNFERVVVNDIPNNDHEAAVVESVTNRINSTTTYTTNYSYDVHRRLTQITYPRGNAVEVEYDDFGNIITRRDRAVTYPTDPDLIQRAEFNTPSTPPGPDNPGCANVTCFFPTRTRDAAGYWTDYLWGTHGGNVKTLEPAGANNLRRLTHRLYSTSGGITRLSSERTCGVSSGAAIASVTCPNTTATQVTNYAYWGGTLLPATVTRTNGAGSLSAVTTYTYDNAGRVTREDGPLSTIADSINYRYDTAGRQTWQIAAELPNGRRVTTRTTYRDADDQPTRVETGYVTGPSSTTLNRTTDVVHTYNSRRLRTQTTAYSDGGTIYTLTQFTYDARNQLLCEARRMNPAQFSSLPSSACNLDTEGSMGPDRIQRHWYDRMGRRYLTRGGYRVLNGGNGEDVFRMSWTNNGRVNWRQDGNGNRTNYSYDVYDRLYRTTFPDGTYEQLTYDARGLVTQLRNRRGQTITSSYDNAGRLTQTSYSTSHQPIQYTYDGLGRETRVHRPSRSTIDYRYDALGRRDRVTQDGRQLNYQYDIAGRRTRLTYPDGFYVTYDYSPAGQVTAIRDNGGATLASYTFDSYGRMRRIDRLNDRDRQLTLDPFARPTRHTEWGFTHIDLTYNPASQIRTRTITSDSHVWNHHATVNRNYAVNNLNQYTSAGGTTFSYDNSGNLARSGTDTYGYDPENRMVSATVGGASAFNLEYDGLGRLNRTSGGGVAIREYLYDGDALVAVYNYAGNIVERYVHGPGVDDPVLWYVNSGTGTANRRFLHADERGSIIGISDHAGTVLNRNTYDDWGIPSPGNAGRFQYTGQMRLNAIGLYYYKARMYSPSLGRFMQTDPIGYDDGMNMYAYVGNDPMNFLDPSGRQSASAMDQRLGINSPVRRGCTSPACRRVAQQLGGFGRGFGSYPRDIFSEVRHGLRSSGALGSEAQNRALLVGQSAGRGIERVIQNPEEAFNRVDQFVRENPAFIAGRGSFGLVVGARGGFGAAALGFGASSLGGVVNAFDRLVGQLEDGGVDPSSFSNGTLGAIAATGLVGGTVSFNAETGDVTARYTVRQTGNLAPVPRRTRICNVREGGC